MSSEANIFTCEYCGQVIIGKDECDCWKARRAKRIAEQIDRAELAIREMFGEESAKQGYAPVEDEHIELMNDIASLIAHEKLAQVTLTLPSGIKAKLTRGAKSAIKVERSETKKASTEVV